MKASAEWFPAKERAFAQAYTRWSVGGINARASAGGVGHHPVQLANSVHYLRGIWFVWVAIWLAFYHSPSASSALSPEEREYISLGKIQSRRDTLRTRPSVRSIRAAIL